MGTAHDAVHSDTANDEFNWITVGGSGSVVILQVGGNEITLASPGLGFWIPVGKAG